MWLSVDFNWVIESKERFPNRREEAALFVIDRIIQADRESAQRSPHLTSLWFGKTVRASVAHRANEIRSRSWYARTFRPASGGILPCCFSHGRSSVSSVSR